MIPWTAAPAILSVLGRNAAGGYESVVAGCAYVRVASIAFLAMEACVRGRDGVCADVAESTKGQGTEKKACKSVGAWSTNEGGGLGSDWRLT